MTKEQIQIAVAEEMGWVEIRSYKISELLKDFPGKYLASIHPTLKVMQTVPNFPESLDACRGFEDSLSEADKCVYAELLTSKLDAYPYDAGYYPGDGTMNWSEVCRIVLATPLQRCEAYLRLKGKWVE